MFQLLIERYVVFLVSSVTTFQLSQIKSLPQTSFLLLIAPASIRFSCCFVLKIKNFGGTLTGK